jgi:hypothetical protein
MPAKAGIQYAAAREAKSQTLRSMRGRVFSGSFIGVNATRVSCSDDLKSNLGVMPAKAGIQYAAAPRLYRERLRLLGPRVRGDDG